MARRKDLRLVHMDEEVRSYMEQLMDDQDTLQMNNSDMNEREQNDGLGDLLFINLFVILLLIKHNLTYFLKF